MFMHEVAEALKTLPRIFLDFVLPQLPGLSAVLGEDSRILDVGCGGGWAVVQIAERFPKSYCVGIDVEPNSVELAQRLIVERDLADRCEARAQSVEQLGEDGTYDVVTSFLVVHEIGPALKSAAFAAVARALKPGGCFLIFDDVLETDEGCGRCRPVSLRWRSGTRSPGATRSTPDLAVRRACREAGLHVIEETGFSVFISWLRAR